MNQMQISKTDIQKKENLEEALCLQAERYRLIKEINQELAKLIYQGGDVNDSLNETLERIGNQYGLRLAAVLEYEGKKREQVWTNCWCLENGALTDSDLKQVCLSPTVLTERGTYGQPYCQGREGLFKGSEECSALFCSREEAGEWSDFEKETLGELAHMVSFLVALRNHKKEDQRQIMYLKRRDLLTGLYIEEAFKSKVKEELVNWRDDRQYAVIYTDINDFSYINDNFGYAAGNDILKAFADLIRGDENRISCRLYSDLFITFFWDIDRDTILEKIVNTSLNFSRKQKEIYPSCSIRLTTGIYFMEDKDENLDIAIENANLTRKSIKGNSSAFCRVYESNMRKQREEEKQVLAEFQRSLEEGGFQVYVQPKFCLSGFEISGGEALVRWKKKDGRIESPALFIPVLERSGYVVELDFYVYEQVLIYMRSWLEAGKEPPVISVNFSRSHFEREGIYRRIMSLTKAYRIEPKYIEIEITESLFATGYELVKTEVRQLRQAGFRVAIDDFGTGYSSLGMLLDIPADIVKVDRSFLNRENHENEKEFIQHMGRLIESVKEEVIFEGIETEEQREFLVKCGFRFGQGFLFDRPMPIQVFQEKYMK